MDAPDIFDKSDEVYLRSQVHHYHTVKKDRTQADEVRFYGTLAQEHGIRVSALVYHIVTWTRNKRTRYPTAYEYDTKAAFGATIGISERQLYTVLRKAKEAGLLDFDRTFRAVRIWVVDKKLYKMPEDDVYKYSKVLADELGLNESILYLKIVYHTQNPTADVAGVRSGPHWFSDRFPWMSVPAVRRALFRLRDMKRIDWRKDEFCYRQNNLYYALNVDPNPRPVSEVTSRQFVEKAALKKPGRSNRPRTDKGSVSSTPRSPANFPFGTLGAENRGTRRSRRRYHRQTFYGYNDQSAD